MHRSQVVIVFVILTCATPVRMRNVSAENLEKWWTQFSTSYPKYEATTQILREMKDSYPNLVNVRSIGKSVQGREMWIINLRVNARQARKWLQPQAKIVTNIHGDETVGRALVLMLAVDLIRGFVNNETRAVKLLTETDIHLLPSMNPDGFEALEDKPNCNPNSSVIGRLNANGVDLNTDFLHPFYSKVWTKPGWRSVNGPIMTWYRGVEVETYPNYETEYFIRILVQPETRNMIRWMQENNFIVSASLFGGKLMVNIPYDLLSPTNITSHRSPHNGTGMNANALTEDNDLFLHLAHLYSRNHQTMSRFSSSCEIDGIEHDGVINGGYWKNQSNTMQDYNYDRLKTFEISVYLSCCKYPDPSTLLVEWNNNKEALYKFFEAAHLGFKGVVKGIEPKMIDKFDVAVFTKDMINGSSVPGSERRTRIRKQGEHEFWRLALPGTYLVTAKANTTEFRDSLSYRELVGDFKVVRVVNASGSQLVILNVWPRPLSALEIFFAILFAIIICILAVISLWGLYNICINNCI